jgi:hypothetical protein
MVDRHNEEESSDGQILTHALLKLRMREGLVPARLHADGRGLAAPLLRLPRGDFPGCGADRILGFPESSLRGANGRSQ